MPMSTAAQARISSAEVTLTRAAAPAARSGPARARSGDGAHALTSRWTTRRRAEAERGFSATSSVFGRTARLVTSRNSGVRPQPHRQVGRADAALGRLDEALLDHAVLERVERDHRHAAAGGAQRERTLEPLLELAELVVDGDSQRLEHALGGMPVPEARGRRDRALDGADELERGLDTPALRSWAICGRSGRKALLAVATEDVREVALAPLVDERGGGALVARIHAHVERRVVHVAEAAPLDSGDPGVAAQPRRTLVAEL